MKSPVTGEAGFIGSHAVDRLLEEGYEATAVEYGVLSMPDKAVNGLNEARKAAHDSQPEKVYADGLNAYPQAMSYWQGESKPGLVAGVGIRKPYANNNRVERLNGTLRERVKVQRGWKSMQTAIPEGQRIHSNFVKPHAALEGQTPAQRAGIDGNDKWLTLFKLALE